MLERESIHHFATEDDYIKSSIAERFQRTLKGKMWRMFTATGEQRYVHVLQQLIDSYNNTRHRSIGRTPASVNKSNEDEVRQHLYPPQPLLREKALAVGTLVLINATKSAFSKGYTPNWKKSTYRVVRRLLTNPLTYEIEDENSQMVEGSFYRAELQPIAENLRTWIVDKQLARRTRNGVEEVLIRWKGRPASEDSWEPSSALFDTGDKQRV